MTKLIKIAQIRTAHGVRGWMKIKLFIEDFDLFKQQRYLFNQDGSKKMNIEKVEGSHDNTIIKFQEINDRDAALLMHSQEMYIEESAFPELSANDYYPHELIGLDVYLNNNIIGCINGVEDYGAGVMISITNIKNYIPFDSDYISSVDLEAGKLHLAQMPSYI